MNSKTKTTAKKEDNRPALVPKLRFPEFREAEGWELVTLQEVSVPVTERVGQRKLTPVSISAGIGFVPQSEKFGRDISGNQYQLYTLVRDGDFVFNKGNSLKFPQGCIYLLQGWGQVAAPNVFICFRLKDGYSNGFFQNCFEQNQHGKQLTRHITSGARSNGLLNISKETFFGVKIPTPSPAEQQKIAECLNSVDELIAAQARKLDALKSHKKGLMQQLFPCEGETFPRLRFPEFKEELKPVGFTELGEIKIGLTHKPEYVKTGKPFLSSRNISNGYIDFENVKYVSEEKFSSMPKSTKPKVGDILFTRVGSNLGNPIILEEDREFGIFVSLGIFRPNKNVSNYYIKHWMDSDYFWRQVKQKVAGGAKDNLNTTWLKEFKLSIPSLSEQQRIADCLTSLDDMITAETQKHEALKIHKKGLMQQLFPSPGAVEA